MSAGSSPRTYTSSSRSRDRDRERASTTAGAGNANGASASAGTSTSSPAAANTGNTGNTTNTGDTPSTLFNLLFFCFSCPNSFLLLILKNNLGTSSTSAGSGLGGDAFSKSYTNAFPTPGAGGLGGTGTSGPTSSRDQQRSFPSYTDFGPSFFRRDANIEHELFVTLQVLALELNNNLTSAVRFRRIK